MLKGSSKRTHSSASHVIPTQLEDSEFFFLLFRVGYVSADSELRHVLQAGSYSVH